MFQRIVCYSTSQPWEMSMNISFKQFIADVWRVIAVIKISQPIVSTENLLATWNPIPPTPHAENIKYYLFFLSVTRTGLTVWSPGSKNTHYVLKSYSWFSPGPDPLFLVYGVSQLNRSMKDFTLGVFFKTHHCCLFKSFHKSNFQVSYIMQNWYYPSMNQKFNQQKKMEQKYR